MNTDITQGGPTEISKNLLKLQMVFFLNLNLYQKIVQFNAARFPFVNSSRYLKR